MTTVSAVSAVTATVTSTTATNTAYIYKALQMNSC